MARYQAVRGTFDVLPDQMPRWHNIEGTARDLAPRFGYREIRTPLFEEAELFTRGMGVMSGLIEQELWTFKDKFGQKLALRTDATTGIIRAYQQNKLYNDNLPLKVFYLAPVFLLGKEGERRSRQSHQFGFEAIGSDNPALDAEVIALAAAFCEELGLEDYKIKLNSLGEKDCREGYLKKLRDYFTANQAQLCPSCKRKFKANPDWVLSCEESGCKSLSQVAPTIYGMLSNGSKANFAALREYLEEMELPVELDPRVVRDSEYYNGCVFMIEYQGKVLGFGGRYDSLIEKLGGKSTPAVGFAFAMEEIMEVLKDTPQEAEDPVSFDFLLRPEGPESAKLLVPLLYTLRQRGISAELDYSYTNGRRRDRVKGEWSYLVTLDESNAFRGNAVLKDLEENSDEKVPVQRLRNRVLHVAGVSAEDERDGSKSGRKKLRRTRKRSDDDKRGERDNSSDEESDSGSSRSRRTRKSRRGRHEEREKDREQKPSRREAEESKQEEESKEKPSRSSRRKQGSREGERDREKDREKAPERERSRDKGKRPGRAEPAKETDRDQGKALVPAFNLGGLGGGESKPAPRSKDAPKKSASGALPPSSGGNLNWSIIPDKEEA
ncbi:MAG: histidine--tRNA ligase [Vulcanimicrobiota bacterium]